VGSYEWLQVGAGQAGPGGLIVDPRERAADRDARGRTVWSKSSLAADRHMGSSPLRGTFGSELRKRRPSGVRTGG